MTNWRSPHIETERDKDFAAVVFVIMASAAIPLILAALIAAGFVLWGGA